LIANGTVPFTVHKKASPLGLPNPKIDPKVTFKLHSQA